MESTKMKAVLWPKYGPPEVLNHTEVDKPIPKDNQILVKVHAATVTAGDCELRRFEMPGWIWFIMRLIMGVRKPRGQRILGQEFAGVVESVGNKITNLKQGDRIFSEAGLNFGAYAEYSCMSNKRVFSIIPENVSYKQAATIPTGGINALHFLKIANVQPNDKVLICGAGGSIGTYGIQFAKLFGAEVTAVDSGLKLETLKSIGADFVIDYQKEDFTKNGRLYDIIIDVVGKTSYTNCLKSLNTNGRYVLGNPRFSGMLRSIFTNIFTSKKVLSKFAGYRVEDMEYIKKLVADEKIKVVIDKEYPLKELVEAHKYVDAGLKTGNVIINTLSG